MCVVLIQPKDNICYAKIEGLEEDDGLDPRNLIHDKFCERGPFFTKYVVCTCSTLCRAVISSVLLFSHGDSEGTVYISWKVSDWSNHPFIKLFDQSKSQPYHKHSENT